MSRAPFVMPKATSAFQPNRRNLRHHHRLALRQPEDARPIWRRHHAQHRGKCRRRVRGSARADQDSLRAAQSGEDRGGAGQRPARRGDRRGRNPAAPKRSIDRRYRRASASHQPRQAPPSCSPIVRKDGTVTAGNASGVNDGAAAADRRQRGSRETPRPDPARANLGAAVAGVPPRIHGHRPRPGQPQIAASDLGSALSVFYVDRT